MVRKISVFLTDSGEEKGEREGGGVNKGLGLRRTNDYVKVDEQQGHNNNFKWGVIYANIEPLCCTPVINIILKINHTSIK